MDNINQILTEIYNQLRIIVDGPNPIVTVDEFGEDEVVFRVSFSVIDSAIRRDYVELMKDVIGVGIQAQGCEQVWVNEIDTEGFNIRTEGQYEIEEVFLEFYYMAKFRGFPAYEKFYKKFEVAEAERRRKAAARAAKRRAQREAEKSAQDAKDLETYKKLHKRFAGQIL